MTDKPRYEDEQKLDELLSLDPDHITTLRRRYVADMRLKNVPVSEIHDGLEEAGILHPDSGKPFSIQTIYNDIKWLDKQLIEGMSRDTAVHRARQINEISEVKRRGFEDDNKLKGAKIVLDAIALEAKLMGTFAPTKIDVRLLGVLIERLESKGLDPQDFIETTIKHLDAT